MNIYVLDSRLRHDIIQAITTLTRSLIHVLLPLKSPSIMVQRQIERLAFSLDLNLELKAFERMNNSKMEKP